MCWWSEFKQHIKSKEECRNLSALIFQQYNATTGTKLTSVVDEKKTPLPHTIGHDERCSFVAIIAVIVGEPPESGFDQCTEIAEKLKTCTIDEKDAAESKVLADSIIHAVTASATQTTKEYVMDKNVAKHLSIYAAAINAAMRMYKETGPEGSFGMKYLLKLLG